MEGKGIAIDVPVGTDASDAAPEEGPQGSPEVNEAAEEAEREKQRREREARAQALTLEIVGDLPYAEVKPPENVLFVCKLNPVTEDEDLNTIFSRFGPIVSCEVIRDKRTGESLQYAFIEYEHQRDCEQAYSKMSGVLIDDHRIHVDFSQSVSRLSDTWRNKTNTRRREQAGGFGGEATLEKKRQYRKAEPPDQERREKDRYRMVFDKQEASKSTRKGHDDDRPPRSRSPEPYRKRPEQRSSYRWKEGRSQERDRDRYDTKPRERSRELDRRDGGKGRYHDQREGRRERPRSYDRDDRYDDYPRRR